MPKSVGCIGEVLCEPAGALNVRLTYTSAEAAAAIGVSEKFLREDMLKLGIPHVRAGRKLIFPRQALADWLNSEAARPKTPKAPD